MGLKWSSDLTTSRIASGFCWYRWDYFEKNRDFVVSNLCFFIVRHEYGSGVEEELLMSLVVQNIQVLV